MIQADAQPKSSIPGSGDADLVAVEKKLLDDCPEAILFIGSDWRINYANRRAGEIAQGTDIVGKNFWTTFITVFPDPERRARFRAAVETQLEIEFDQETVSAGWTHVCLRPHADGLAVYVRDVTDAKLAEKALQQREADFNEFFENGNVALHWVGPDGTILWANEAELSMLGYLREEYIGRSIADFHADTPVIEDILTRLTNRENLRDYQARLRRKDGSVIDVAISSSVYWKSGEFIHTRCFTRDISAEKAKAEYRAYLGAIIESSDDGIISKDLNGIITSWNKSAERLFGYTSEEAIGQSVATLLIPHDRQGEEPEILSRLRRGERVDHVETKRKRKDGTLLDISLTISPIKDLEGRIVGASKIARDITENVRNQEAVRSANEALRRSNADLEQFAYSASHDLQEPLRMVSTYAEMLRRKYVRQIDAKADEYIGFIVEGGSRMERLLRDLRAFAQAATASSVVPVIESRNVLVNALTNLKTAIDESGAEITSGSLPAVSIHEFQLGQLFQNIIGNAIRYRSEAPPKIHVAAEPDKNGWKFSIRDNGIGIDSAYKEQIFGIFERLHTSSEYPGTGMGLAICQRIVERTGGRIWVESEPGRGSTFFFTIRDRPDV